MNNAEFNFLTLEEKMVKIKNFIQVKGGADIGKTTAITRCFLKLLAESQSNLQDLMYLENGDFIALVELDGKIIGFVSGGDDRDSVKKNYEMLCEMSKGEIEVCVFATRTKGYSVAIFEEILKENGKQKADAVFENKWFDICKYWVEQGTNYCTLAVGQDDKKKKEIVKHLQEQSEKIFKEIKIHL